ncbi:hypothetical protein [Dyadobacter sp. BHUBP1]|uniref:hypothetical protein n=1 Tax=Dyadobacter sp. BHUBP1 TaxID=3424178 RepID=UPI003D334077
MGHGLYPFLRRLPDAGHIAAVQNLEVGETCWWYQLGNSVFGQSGDVCTDRHACAAGANAKGRTQVNCFPVGASGGRSERRGLSSVAIRQRQGLVLAGNAGEREHAKRQQICNDDLHASKVGEMRMQQVGKNKFAASKQCIAVNQPLTPIVI